MAPSGQKYPRNGTDIGDRIALRHGLLTGMEQQIFLKGYKMKWETPSWCFNLKTHTLTYALAVGLESKDLLLIHRLGRQWFLLGLGLVGRLDINFRLNPIEA